MASRLGVANITLQSSQGEDAEHVEFSGRSFRLVRIGTHGDLKKAEELVWQWSLKTDAIAVSGIREARAAGVFEGDVERINEVRDTTSRVPVRDGAMLADVLQE